MLLIVLTLAGTAYLYISGALTGKTSTAFEIMDSYEDTITIRNSGTGPITSFRSVKIDNNDAIYLVSKSDSSLVGYWKMDESSWVNDCTTKSVKDSSGTGNDGKACPATAGPTGGAIGRFGDAGSFDGSDDYVDAGNINYNTFGALTVEFWIKRTRAVLVRDIPIGSGYPPWQFSLEPTKNYVEIQIDGTIRAFDNLATIPLDTWTNIAITHELGTGVWKYYVNGQVSNQGVVAGSAYTGAGATVLGTNGDFNPSISFEGLLDEVKIYNRALSESEVKAEYNIGKIINPGEAATIKIYNTLSKGTHTVRMCTSSMCNVGYLTIT